MVGHLDLRLRHDAFARTQDTDNVGRGIGQIKEKTAAIFGIKRRLPIRVAAQRRAIAGGAGRTERKPENVAQHPLAHEVAQMGHVGIERRLRTGFDDRFETGFAHSVGNGAGVGHRGRHWLLQQEMLARSNRLEGKGNMGAGRGEDEDNIDARLIDHLVVLLITLFGAKEPLTGRRARRHAITNRGQFNIRHLHQVRQIVGRGNNATADHTDFDRTVGCLTHEHGYPLDYMWRLFSVEIVTEEKRGVKWGKKSASHGSGDDVVMQVPVTRATHSLTAPV